MKTDQNMSFEFQVFFFNNQNERFSFNFKQQSSLSMNEFFTGSLLNLLILVSSQETL